MLIIHRSNFIFLTKTLKFYSCIIMSKEILYNGYTFVTNNFMAILDHQEVSEAYHIMQDYLSCGPLGEVIVAALKLQSDTPFVESYSDDDVREWLSKLGFNGDPKRLWKSLRRKNRNTSSGLKTRMKSRWNIRL